MNMRHLSAVATSISAVLLLAGCASKDPHLVSDTAFQSPCDEDMTYSCVEYLGRKLRCYCVSRDELREILEPENQ